MTPFSPNARGPALLSGPTRVAARRVRRGYHLPDMSRPSLHVSRRSVYCGRGVRIPQDTGWQN